MHGSMNIKLINLWNCCILLVDLFESYDDARTCEHQIPLPYRQLRCYIQNLHNLRVNYLGQILLKIIYIFEVSQSTKLCSLAHAWLTVCFSTFFFRHYNFILWTFCPSQHIISTYCDPGCSQSNSLFSFSSCHLLCHLPVCSLVFLVVVLTSVSTCILFSPFSLPTFNVNGQTSLIFVLLCNLLYSYFLLINLIHRLLWFSRYQTKKSRILIK